VELRYHYHKDFTALGPDAVAELEEHRQALRANGENGHLPVLDKDRKKQFENAPRRKARKFASVAAPMATKRHKTGPSNGYTSDNGSKRPQNGPRTGVEFRYHNHMDFLALSPDAKEELEEHRQSLRDRGEIGHLPVMENDRKKQVKRQKGKNTKKGARQHRTNPSLQFQAAVAAAVAAELHSCSV
jgi:ethanolamine utilization cobalamin adenosyltransferase